MKIVKEIEYTKEIFNNRVKKKLLKKDFFWVFIDTNKYSCGGGIPLAEKLRRTEGRRKR